MHLVSPDLGARLKQEGLQFGQLNVTMSQKQHGDETGQ